MAVPAPHLSIAALVGIGTLVAWRLYRRTRKLMVRQRFSSRRSWLSLVLLPLLIVLLLVSSYAHPLGVAARISASPCRCC